MSVELLSGRIDKMEARRTQLELFMILRDQNYCSINSIILTGIPKVFRFDSPLWFMRVINFRCFEYTLEIEPN